MKKEKQKSKDYPNELMFNNTVQYFFTECIKRVNNKRMQTDGKFKPYVELLAVDDRSIISNFFSNNRTKNNPYLITPKLLGYKKNQKTEDKCSIIYTNDFFKEYEDKYSPYTDDSGNPTGFMYTLNYNHPQEILWGNSNEIHKDIIMIFNLILSEVSMYIPSYEDIIESALCDYIPYAKASAFYKINKEKHISLLETYGINNINTPEIEWLKQRNYAILYFCTKQRFLEELELTFLDFIKDKIDFSKIDQKLKDEYIIPILIPLIQKHSTNIDISLGARVKQLIENDLIHAERLLDPNISDLPNVEARLRMLNHASSQYITELERFQYSESMDAFRKLGVFID